jgi:hypothetical protein
VRQIISVDITHFSFEEFVRFVFDHDLPVEAEMPTAEERSRRCYYRTNAIFDPEALSGQYVRLFRESGSLLGMFSKPQLEHGFSSIGSGCTFSVKKLIWNTDLAFERREAVVKAMFYLFRDFFRVEPLRYRADMWWDGLCYCWEMGQRERSRGGEDSRMQDVMFATMSDILSIDSEECRFAALHGLHHLHHPATLELIKRYKSTLPYLERWCRDYDEEEAAWREHLERRRFAKIVPPQG